MKNSKQKKNYSNLLPTIQEIFFNDLELDEVLLEIVNCSGKYFNVSRFMVGIFDENIEDYTFQYIFQNEKAKKINSGPMTMKGKKFNPGFRDQLNHKVYSCEDTSKTKTYEELKSFYTEHKIRSTIFTGIWRQDPGGLGQTLVLLSKTAMGLGREGTFHINGSIAFSGLGGVHRIDHLPHDIFHIKAVAQKITSGFV